MLAQCPRICGIDPVDRFISGAFQCDATTIGGYISRCSNIPEDDVLVFNDKIGRIDIGGCTV